MRPDLEYIHRSAATAAGTLLLLLLLYRSVLIQSNATGQQCLYGQTSIMHNVTINTYVCTCDLTESSINMWRCCLETLLSSFPLQRQKDSLSCSLTFVDTKHLNSKFRTVQWWNLNYKKKYVKYIREAPTKIMTPIFGHCPSAFGHSGPLFSGRYEQICQITVLTVHKCCKASLQALTPSLKVPQTILVRV